MDEQHAREHAFLMVDTSHAKRHPGWPLDSLSIVPETGLYFVEETAAAHNDPYYAEVSRFLRESLLLG